MLTNQVQFPQELRPPRMELQNRRMAESVYSSDQPLQPTQQYWNQQEQNWLKISYNMNLMAFANYELFKSANINVNESPNPVICILCVILKLTILILYILTPYFPGMILYEIIVVVGAIDFWIIKNVCGRVLVGLRWWVEIDEYGCERWVFETRTTANGSVHRIHSRVFWFVQLFMFFMFAGMFIINAVTYNISVSICMIFPALFTGFNLWAFNMCNRVKKSRMGEQLLQSSVGRRSVKMQLKLD